MVRFVLALAAALAMLSFFFNSTAAEEPTYSGEYDGYLLTEVPCRDKPDEEAFSPFAIPAGTPALVGETAGDWMLLLVFPVFDEYWSFSSCYVQESQFYAEASAPESTVPSTEEPTVEPAPTEEIPTELPTQEPTTVPETPTTEPASEPTAAATQPSTGSPVDQTPEPVTPTDEVTAIPTELAATQAPSEPVATAPVQSDFGPAASNQAAEEDTPSEAKDGQLTITAMPSTGSGDGQKSLLATSQDMSAIDSTQEQSFEEFLTEFGKFVIRALVACVVIVLVWVAIRGYLEHKDDDHYLEIVQRRR